MPNLIIKNSCFHYPGFNDCLSFCRVQIFSFKNYIIIVATELKENSGMSICNASPLLSNRIREVYPHLVDPYHSIFVEHFSKKDSYGVKNRKDTHVFDQVTYKIDTVNGLLYSPQYSHIGKASSFYDIFKIIEKNQPSGSMVVPDNSLTQTTLSETQKISELLDKFCLKKYGKKREDCFSGTLISSMEH